MIQRTIFTQNKTQKRFYFRYDQIMFSPQDKARISRLPLKEAMETYNISRATYFNWKRLKGAELMDGRTRNGKIDDELSSLVVHIAIEHPDFSLQDIRNELNKSQIDLSRPSISKILKQSQLYETKDRLAKLEALVCNRKNNNLTEGIRETLQRLSPDLLTDLDKRRKKQKLDDFYVADLRIMRENDTEFYWYILFHTRSLHVLLDKSKVDNFQLFYKLIEDMFIEKGKKEVQYTRCARRLKKGLPPATDYAEAIAKRCFRRVQEGHAQEKDPIKIETRLNAESRLRVYPFNIFYEKNKSIR